MLFCLCSQNQPSALSAVIASDSSTGDSVGRRAACPEELGRRPISPMQAAAASSCCSRCGHARWSLSAVPLAGVGEGAGSYVSAADLGGKCHPQGKGIRRPLGKGTESQAALPPVYIHGCVGCSVCGPAPYSSVLPPATHHVAPSFSPRNGHIWHEAPPVSMKLNVAWNVLESLTLNNPTALAFVSSSGL